MKNYKWVQKLKRNREVAAVWIGNASGTVGGFAGLCFHDNHFAFGVVFGLVGAVLFTFALRMVRHP